MSQQPSVGRVVHYVSRGSADGVFPATCRAAVVTEVHPDTPDVSLAVLNPTGLFFGPRVAHDAGYGVRYDAPLPGTWHWPERVPAP